MKQRIFTLFAAISALVMVSCSKDTTTTVEYGKFAGGKLHITTSIAQTRTALTDHNLVWSEGDTFGIYYVDADGKTLGAVESPAYEEGKTDYTLENVPAGTAYLCCVYPYDEDMSADDDLSELSVNIPTYELSSYEQYEFDGSYNTLAAKAAVNGDSVSVVFEQLLSILEFNIYDTEGDGDELFYGITVTVGEDESCSGSGALDFLSGDKPALSGYNSIYTSAGSAENKEPKILDSKDGGVKAYLYVAKNVYKELTVEIVTSDANIMNPYTFKYTDVDLTYDGRTFNIDLSKTPQTELVTDLSYETKGPWLLSVTFNVDPACVKYVVGAMPTEELDFGDGLFSNDGYDEDAFIDAAKDALDAAGDYSKWLAFDVVSGASQTVTELYLNGGTFDEPKGLRINEKRGEYTIAVYAVDDNGEGSVYTTTFTAPAFTSGSGTVTPAVKVVNNLKNSATATISAEGASYIFYGYSNTLGTAPTNDQVKAMFVNNEQDTYFAEYESEITLNFDKFGTNKYIVWAVAIDESGAISSVASQTFEADDTTVEFTGSAAINSFEALHLWQTNDDDASPSYALEAKFTLSADVEKVALFYVGESATQGEDPIKLTLDLIKSSLINEMDLKNGMVYTKAEAESGINIPVATIYDASDADKKNPKPEKTLYIFAVATDASGKFGKIVNLAGPGEYEMDDDNFLKATFSFDLSVEKKEVQGGGDTADWWTSTYTPTFDMFSSMGKVFIYDTSKAATKMWLIKVGTESDAESVGWMLKAKYTEIVGKLFKNYATDKGPSSEADVLVSFDGNVPTSESAGTFVIADTAWAQNWNQGDVFALVAEYGENVLSAKVAGIDAWDDLASICSVNANNKPAN